MTWARDLPLPAPNLGLSPSKGTSVSWQLIAIVSGVVLVPGVVLLLVLGRRVAGKEGSVRTSVLPIWRGSTEHSTQRGSTGTPTPKSTIEPPAGSVIPKSFVLDPHIRTSVYENSAHL